MRFYIERIGSDGIHLVEWTPDDRPPARYLIRTRGDHATVKAFQALFGALGTWDASTGTIPVFVAREAQRDGFWKTVKWWLRRMSALGDADYRLPLDGHEQELRCEKKDGVDYQTNVGCKRTLWESVKRLGFKYPERKVAGWVIWVKLAHIRRLPWPEELAPYIGVAWEG